MDATLRRTTPYRTQPRANTHLPEPTAINDGYLPPRLTRVLAFNDEPVRNLAHLTRMVRRSVIDA